MKRLNATQLKAVRKLAARLTAEAIEAIDLASDDVLSRVETVQAKYDPDFIDGELDLALGGALDRELHRIQRLYKEASR